MVVITCGKRVSFRWDGADLNCTMASNRVVVLYRESLSNAGKLFLVEAGGEGVGGGST
jgi:hypothetical protein